MNSATTKTAEEKVLVECPKCLGRGYFSSFAHIANGVCFYCWGACKVEVKIGGHETYVHTDRVEPVISLKVDGEVFQVACFPGPRSFEVSVWAPERRDDSSGGQIGCLFFFETETVASDGMTWEGKKMSKGGKRALFAAALAVHRQALAWERAGVK